MSVGPAMREVPVSTATWQCLSLHSPCFLFLMVMSSISTCQYPGLDTGTQNNLEAMRDSRHSPNVTSLASSSSAPKKKEKRLCLRVPSRIMQSRTLNRAPSDICGRLRPKIPSKGTRLKGSSDSSVAVTKLALVHNSPTQTVSLTKTPLISPVPNVIVTTSRSPLAGTALSGESAKAISTAVVDKLTSYRLWAKHAASVHLTEGMSKLPDPVSKTTTNFWGGDPMEISPKYSLARTTCDDAKWYLCLSFTIFLWR
mmetsp:Transcript_52706/g.140077  ORF Transcript_52706/g.140077 Transcript_52706/m.140077 type:complete len:255 (-) Transcript_52706:161-925(-)